MTQIIRLANGVSVANFSTAHDFRFDCGAVLPGVDPAECRKYSINIFEDGHTEPAGRFQNITIQPRLTEEVRQKMAQYQSMWQLGDVDVVICPLVMMSAMKEEGYNVLDSPFRSIRQKDRLTREVWSSKFCI